MPIYLKTSDGFRSVVSTFLKTSDGWRSIVKAYLKTSNGWRSIFESSLSPAISSPVTISKSTNSTTKLITLTGTNYPWTNSTGLTYDFIRDSEVPSLDSGTISNPVTSNTKTYLITDSNLTKNQTNTFTFKVTGTNSTYNTSSFSEASTTVEGVRNITNLTNTVIDYTFLQFEWSGGLYANSFVYQYQTYNNGIEGSWSSEQIIPSTDTFVGLLNLQSNTTYRFRIKGITGTTLANQGYSGNWAEQTGTTKVSSAPTQLTSPTITGSGYAFESINGTSGTYSSGTYLSKSTYIGKSIYSTSPTSGTTTALAAAGSPPYTITQADTEAPSYYFYYVDAVVANDGQTTYYYYSSGIKSKVSILDNYNRNVSNGLGTMTGSYGYIYNRSVAGSSWSVNGSYAVMASAVSGSNSSSYPQQSVEMAGKTDITATVNFPSGADGLGLVFWATSAGSWWASRVYRTASTATKYTYGITQTSTNTYYLGNRNVTTTIYKYNKTTSTNKYYYSYNCFTYYTNRSVTTYDCPSGYSYIGSGLCSGNFYPYPTISATPTTTYVCDSPTASSVGSCSAVTSTCYGCSTSGNLGYCGTEDVTTCEASGNGAYCGSETSTSTVCDVSGGNNCGPFTSTSTVCSGSYSQYNNSTYPSGACNQSSSSVTLYTTQVNLLMGDGSTASSQASQTIESGVESPTAVLGMKVITSGNSISSSVYSDSGLTSQLGSTLSYNASSPTKSDLVGRTYAGLIKTPPGSSGGIHFDNLSII